MKIGQLAAAFMLILGFQGCARNTQAPEGPHVDPGPAGFADVFLLLDPYNPQLSEMWHSLSSGDSLQAAMTLMEFLETNPPRSGPTLSFADPLSSADALMSGVLKLPRHEEWPLPEDPDWGENPFSEDADGGANWRFQYHCLEWTLPLLIAYEQTGDDRYLDRLLFLISDYFADNFGSTPPSDMTWKDMAAAFRSQNILHIWARLLENEAIALEDIPEWLVALWRHGRMLSEDVPYHPESNHGIFHNRGLISLGLGVSIFAKSTDWFDLGRERIEVQILEMVNDEGVYLENATYYHFYLLITFIGVDGLLDLYDLNLSPIVTSRLELMYHFAAHSLTPRADLPMIGDSPQAINLNRYRNLSPQFDYSIMQGTEGVIPGETAVSFPEAGYAFLRSGWGLERPFELESYIAFDFGPNSDGDGSHGHCDGLSFIFLSKGLEWIVDPGFYALRSGAWRDYFVGTSAHNGIMIEGESAVQASPEYGVFRSAQDFDFHSATVHFVGGSLWQRSLVFLKPDDLLVIDLVLPVEESSITHFQQWHPDARWSERAGGFLLEQAGMSCDVIFARALGSEVITGMEDPIQGWYSVAYGEAKPNYTLIRRETGQTITSCTLFHVYEGTDSIQSFELIEDEGGSSFVFSIERESSQDETIEVWIESGWVERNSSR